MIITGEGGQQVSRDFGFPGEFIPASWPNMYAPGPVDRTGTSGAAGGNETDITFFAGAGSIRAAGFGCNFIDADWPQDGPASMQLYNAQGALLADSGTITTANAKRAFVGLVTVNAATSLPVAAIGRVHIVNGSGWPGNDWNEGDGSRQLHGRDRRLRDFRKGAHGHRARSPRSGGHAGRGRLCAGRPDESLRGLLVREHPEGHVHPHADQGWKRR